MDKLLSLALDAHGGLERWSLLRHVTTNMTIGGAFWAEKGHPHLLGDELVEIDPIHPHTKLTSTGVGRTIEFDNRYRHLRVKAGDGSVIDDQDDPRATMANYGRTMVWTVAQTAYFVSYALWHDLTVPFLFTHHGVEAHEIEPWVERGETWRRLSVTFPGSIASHCKEQRYYFDAAGLLRRMDYEPVLCGSAPFAQYTDDHRTIDGIVFPMKRRVHPRNEDNTVNLDVAAITYDLRDVTLVSF